MVIMICGFKFSEDSFNVQRIHIVILVWVVFIFGHSEDADAWCEEANSCMLP